MAQSWNDSARARRGRVQTPGGGGGDFPHPSRLARRVLGLFLREKSGRGVSMTIGPLLATRLCMELYEYIRLLGMLRRSL
jgi:hypothetical protein